MNLMAPSQTAGNNRLTAFFGFNAAGDDPAVSTIAGDANAETYRTFAALGLETASEASTSNVPLAQQLNTAVKLNARYAVGGDVRKSAGGFDISLRIDDTQSGKTLWRETISGGETRHRDLARGGGGAGRRHGPLSEQNVQGYPAPKRRVDDGAAPRLRYPAPVVGRQGSGLACGRKARARLASRPRNAWEFPICAGLRLPASRTRNWPRNRRNPDAGLEARTGVDGRPSQPRAKWSRRRRQL